MKLPLIIVTYIFVFSLSYGQNNQGSQVPRLVIFLNIDELRTEHLISLRDKFSHYGFNQLVNKGTFYHKGNYNTNSSFHGIKRANMHTGSYPNTHGIIGDSWYSTRTDTEEKSSRFITADEAVRPDSGHIQFATLHSTTITDELNLYYKGQSKVASISLSPLNMAYQGFSDKKLTFWFNRTTGKMTSADTIERPWVEKFNSMKFADTYTQRQWGPLRDLKKYQEYISKETENPRHFMYEMKTKANKGLPYQKIIGSPYGNVLIRDFMASLIINEQMGKDAYPDILSINLSCKPFTQGPHEIFDAEIEDLLLRMDLQIESIIQLIKDNVGLERTLLVLSATPTTGWLPQTLKINKLNTGVFNGKKTAALLNLYLMAIYGQGKWVKGYHDKQFYFNHPLLEKESIDLNEIQKKSAKFLLEVSGISKTITAQHLRVNEYTTGIYHQLQQNYFYGRSGDLFISLKPGWIEEINGGQTIKYEHNCYAPLIFFGWNTKTEQIFESVNMIDVAPTISTLLQITEPNGCIGEPLKEVVQQSLLP
ncbi:alkaline phosphatase family protein [Saccharicrinis fermentans]|uniref:Alkaline phosphatase n=1 Tax=Saccharicrinis fermentans DSM 9555 = JCM 21142 TaxID=869213 RepID=W7YAS4_9BACT|nr:alkaline phosphatase family protein [Saccharicrinis fermentans]GAF04688.1 alkaline phosphatase precursor [Saccharicrinis fermentans DSM 9555 = JCM 21142]